jgi:hypothetical protein
MPARKASSLQEVLVPNVEDQTTPSTPLTFGIAPVAR